VRADHRSRPQSPISDALEELAAFDSALAEIVDLKYFCGFTHAEIAAMHQVSERTVQRQWEKARLYLHRSIRAIRCADTPATRNPAGNPHARTHWRFRHDAAAAARVLWRDDHPEGNRYEIMLLESLCTEVVTATK
jgi:hypothetical protein